MAYKKFVVFVLALACLCGSSTVDAGAARAAAPKKRLGGQAKAKPSRGTRQLQPQAAQSSRQLASKKKSEPKKMNPSDAIYYGEQIFIQNAGHYRKILVGNVHKKSKKKKKKKYWNPYTYDVWERKTPDLDSKWEILSYTETGGGVPRDCVRYGDTIVFKMVKSIDRPYLGCGSGDGDRDATSWAWNKDKDTHNGFKWVIRSDPGKTGTATRVDDDPAYGMCVIDLSKAMVQSHRTVNRWLKGSDGKETNDVWVKDIYDGDELAAAQKYMWIFRKDKALGHQDEGIQCLATGSVGVWNYLATATGGDYTITYTQGNTRTKDRSETSEENWSLSVSTSVSANFAFGSATAEVTGTLGGSASETVSNSLAQNEDISIATTFYEKGVVWQYAIKMKDLCVPDWEVTTKEIFMTASRNEPPCCLPGQFYDLERPHGPCVKGTPCQCDKETCEAFDVEMKAIEEEEAAAAAEEEDSEEDGSSEEGSYSSEEESDIDCSDMRKSKRKKAGCVESGSNSDSGSLSYDESESESESDSEEEIDDDDAWLQEYMSGGSGGGTDGGFYNDDLGGYQDDYYFDDDFGQGGYGQGGYGQGGYGQGGYGGLGAAPAAPPKFMYNGDGPLFSLNINQANTNNNGGGSGGSGGSAPQGGGEAGDSGPDDDDDDGLDEDFSLDDDANNDDYLDIVVDAMESLGIDDMGYSRKLRGAETTEA